MSSQSQKPISQGACASLSRRVRVAGGAQDSVHCRHDDGMMALSSTVDSRLDISMHRDPELSSPSFDDCAAVLVSLHAGRGPQNSRSPQNSKRFGCKLCNVTSPKKTLSQSRPRDLPRPRRQATVEMPEVLPKTTIVGRAVAAQNNFTRLPKIWPASSSTSAGPETSTEASEPEHPTFCPCFLYSAF